MDLREALNRQWAPHGRQRSSTAATRSAGGSPGRELAPSDSLPVTPYPFTFSPHLFCYPHALPIISSNGSRSCPGTMPLWGLLCRLPETPWPGSLSFCVAWTRPGR